MSELIPDGRIRVGGDGDQPSVIDAGTSADDVARVMADARRRHVPVVISEEPSPMDVSTFAGRVADRGTSADSEPASEPAMHRLRVSLHHQRLPKLASAGLIESDTEGRTIESDDEGRTIKSVAEDRTSEAVRTTKL